MTRFSRGLLHGLIFISVVAVGLLLLFTWRDARVDSLLEGASEGDVLQVESDECRSLQERELINSDIDCGYWDEFEIRLIRDPEQ